MVLSRENYKYKRMYTEDNTTLNKVAALITWYGLGGEYLRSKLPCGVSGLYSDYEIFTQYYII